VLLGVATLLYINISLFTVNLPDLMNHRTLKYITHHSCQVHAAAARSVAAHHSYQVHAAGTRSVAAHHSCLVAVPHHRVNARPGARSTAPRSLSVVASAAGYCCNLYTTRHRS
jgi:hypothetical protein